MNVSYHILEGFFPTVKISGIIVKSLNLISDKLSACHELNVRAYSICTGVCPRILRLRDKRVGRRV